MRGQGDIEFTETMSEGIIGPIRLRNRIVLPAMDMNLCDHGVITDGEIAHYARRAAGGTAMVITGSGAVAYPVGATSRHQPGLSEDRFIPGLRSLAEAVHAEGSRLCIQLTHHGKTARVDMADERPMLVPSIPEGSPDMSALQDNTGEELMALAAAAGGKAPQFHEADEDDLLRLIDDFASAARRVREAGCDAVEIHAAHGYILSTFLSAADNRRTDRWGGSLENRCRLTEEVTRAVREAAGDDLAVIVRISGQEFGGAGALSNAEAAAAATRLEAAGAHAIHVTGWGRNSFANFTDGPLPDTVGAYRGQTAAIKSTVAIPVIAVGRLLPEVAEEMLAEGQCDFVAMGRQLLADPDIANKLKAGRQAAIRPCINCYVCVEQNFFDLTPRCAVNPALGDETAAEITRTKVARHIVVVGGGPAGVEYARLASQQGHQVTLLEAGDRLGGTAWFSQLTTPANGPFVDWQAHQLGQASVDVRLRTTATVAEVRSLRPDLVVVATGATRGRPAIPGIDQHHVLSGDDLRALLAGEPVPGQAGWLQAALRLGRKLRVTSSPERLRRLSKLYLPLGKHVVVIGGGLVGLELAEFLAERKRTVTVLEEGPAIGLPMASPRRWTAVRKATDHGVTLHRKAEVNSVGGNEVTFTVGDTQETIAADSVIIAGGVVPSAPLATQLSDAGFEVQVIGDADNVGYIEGAVHSAWTAARALA